MPKENSRTVRDPIIPDSLLFLAALVSRDVC